MPPTAETALAPALAALAARLRRARSVLLFSHIGPDADNVGALCALAAGLARIVPRVVAANLDPVPRLYRFLPGASRIVPLGQVEGIFDVAVALDCSDAERPGVDPRRFAPFLANVDHHLGNTMFGDLNAVDPARTSTCEIVHLLLGALDAPVDRDMAVCLYTGLMTDTIRFLTSDCTPEVYRLVADLVARGVDPGDIGTRVFMNNTLASARALAEVLAGVTPTHGGRLAAAVIGEELRARHGATLEDTAPIVNHLIALEGVECALVCEFAGPLCNVALRSKTTFDVGAVARELGGGGHLNAAGAQVPAEPGVAGRVVALVEERMRCALDHSSRLGTSASAAC